MKKFTLTIFAFLSLSLFIGCAVQPAVYNNFRLLKDYNEFSNTTQYYTYGNDLTAFFSLDIIKSLNKGNEYAFIIRCMSENWLFITEDSLQIKFENNEIIKLPTIGEPKRRVMAGYVFEELYYLTDLTTIQKVINSSLCKIQIISEKGYTIKEIPKSWKINATSFLKYCVDQEKLKK